MLIHIKHIIGKTITLEVCSCFTVNDLKHKIWLAENIPLHEQRIIYEGRLIEDDRKLSDYNITDGTILHLIPRLGGMGIPMDIRFEGKFISRIGGCFQCTTVRHVKEQIQEETGIPFDEQYLYFNYDEKLEGDDRSLSDFNMKRGGIIDLYRVPSTVEIFMKFKTKEVIPLIVCLCSKIKAIKMKINEEFKIPVEKQHLSQTFGGSHLEDDGTLREYDIENGATLYLSEDN